MPQPPNLQAMLAQAQDMMAKQQEAQEALKDERVETSAGGGMVKVVVDGKSRLKEIKLSPEALNEKDVTLLEDLILTAIGEAQKTAEDQMQESIAKVTGGFKLPF